MKKILVPVDFSDHTGNSIKMACSFAMRHQLGIILLHSYFDMIFVQTFNSVSPDDYMPVIEPDMALLDETYEREMNELVRTIHDVCPSLSVETEVTGIELHESVNNICSRNDILLIVIGASGTGKKESFSGSTASSLFASSPVPVLAIPEKNRFEDDSLQNILYATNFAEAAQTEVRFILDYFIEKSNSLHCVHLRFPETDNLLDDVQMETLSKPFNKEIHAKKVSFRIIDTEDVEEALNPLVEKEHIGLISFHKYNRGFFQRFFHKAVEKKDIYRFNIPLLVFRKYEVKEDES